MTPPEIFPADPRAGYLAAANEIDAAIRRVLSSGRYILGPEGEAFEREFAAYLGTAGAVAVANGTDALELALRALGVGPGDRVATVANTVSAAVAAIAATGAEPVFIEIDPATLLLDPAALAVRLRASAAGRIKAIVPVHLYGLPCAMPEILALARTHGASVVEDCAQAHGALIAGRKVGAWGDLAAFSFYPTKNLGALGDAGLVTGTDAAALAEVGRLRQYGWRTRYVSDTPGRNSRMDELQAAILRVRLGRLGGENAQRAQLAASYQERWDAPGVRLPVAAEGRTPVWHQFVVRTPRRDELLAWLAARGVHGAVLYPVPLHRQPAYAQPGTTLPHTEAACAEVLSLPLHPGLSVADTGRVAALVAEWARAADPT